MATSASLCTPGSADQQAAVAVPWAKQGACQPPVKYMVVNGITPVQTPASFAWRFYADARKHGAWDGKFPHSPQESPVSLDYNLSFSGPVYGCMEWPPE